MPGRSKLPLRRKRDESGAALVEFAMLAPLLILLLFGIIEFAWIFSQNLDTRHGAREGARIAAVDEFVGTSPEQVTAEICARMDTAAVSSATLVSASRTANTVGADVLVTVNAPAQSITGLFSAFIPSTLRLTSTTTIRLEQPNPSWPMFSEVSCP